MRDKTPLLAASREDIAFFAALPVNDRARVDFANVRGVQFLEPLFAFSGRMCRLRRDTLPQTAVAIVRRPPADRECHRAVRRSMAAICR